jgi:hypothetical protein
VAPSSRARSSRLSLMSMAMIVAAPTALAAMMALRPTAPVPEIATLLPARTRSAFMTAPAPVMMPQPRGPSRSRGASLETFAVFRSRAIACVAKDDWPKILAWIRPPSPERGEVPSGRDPMKLRGANSTQ